MSSDHLLNVIRREAAIAVASREFTGTLVVTAFDPQTYAVKGMIMPHEVESGWVRMTGDHIGNGYGNVAGPKVGTADDLSGDQFALEFDRGDPNTLIATHRIFSDVDVPPTVQSGEVLNKAQQGQEVYLDAAGNVIVSRPDGSMSKLKANGDVVHMPKTSGGTAYHGGDPDDGKSVFDYVMTASGQPSTNVKAKIS